MAAAGWALAAFLLLPHAMLLLLSFVPAGTWTTQPLPPFLSLGNYASLFSETERLRPIVNSLWMAAAATAAALVAGPCAARLAAAKGARLRRRARDA